MSGNDEGLQWVLGHCADLPARTYAAGETLIAEGPASGRLLILAVGSVEVLRGDLRVAVADEPGSVFGEISALLTMGHSATVRAMSPVMVYEVEAAGDYLQQHPAVMLHVARILARRLVDATSYLADIKQQFAGRDDHFGMVDAVLDSLLQQQAAAPPAVSSTAKDPRL